jgi:hypothetical protein
MVRARLTLLLLSLLLPVLVLAGCDAASEGVAAVTVGSIAIIHRTPVDAVVSLVTGKDCSAVRLEQGKTYCRPMESPPELPQYCTRSLGVVDCWTDPAAMSDRPPEVADGPRALTPEQDADRTRRWP